MSKNLNLILWIVQILLTLLFLMTGVMKLILPIAEMTKQAPLPGAFLRFIGASEILGALGLVLPGMLRIRRGLTPLAGIGLDIILAGATVIMLKVGGIQAAAMPFIVGLLVAFVVHGRRAWLQNNFNGPVDLRDLRST